MMRLRFAFVFALALIISVGLTPFAVQAAPPGVPILASPADGLTTTSHTLTLNWNAVPNASSYDAQIGDTSDFATVLRSVSRIGALYFAIGTSNALPDGVYYWRARANNTDGSGEWSEVRSFTIYTLAPVLASPADGLTTTNHTLTINWNAVSDATSYDAQISGTSDFATVLRSVSRIGALYFAIGTSNALPDGVYYWRARVNTLTGTGPWSEIRRFAVQSLAPVLSSPADSATMTSHTLTINWNSVSNATSYDAQISGTSDFATVLRSASRIGALYFNIGSANALPDGIYYWRARANTMTDVGPWSEVRSFTI
ncbi:MAG TPA: hypothetical protein VHO69_01325, partial [Phototrophicaceae bacterium]|nr:hypothetical protein [Phototrophicaceae bacterium]